MSFTKAPQHPARLLVFGIAAITGYEIPVAAAPPSPTNSAVVELGSRLFADPSLSADGHVSCSTCHKPDHAFSDGRPVAVGFNQKHGVRNTPSLLSLSGTPFFWDGREANLQAVVLQPFTNPVEMGLENGDELLRRLQTSERYHADFLRAFPKAPRLPTLDEVAIALAAFVNSIPKGNSSFDRYEAGNTAMLSTAATHGYRLFTGIAGCAECHRASGKYPAFTDGLFHSTLINPQLAAQLPNAAVELANDPLMGPALNGRIESDRVVSELGHYVVTHDPKDIGSFRTPSLRNVALTAPYMHDGSAATLRDAVDREIYYRSLQSNRPNTLTEADRRDLVAFLEALASDVSNASTRAGDP